MEWTLSAMEWTLSALSSPEGTPAHVRPLVSVLVLFVALLGLTGCGGSSSSSSGSSSNPGYAWTNVAPSGGFVASIAFNPQIPNEVWASGDDSSGLYKSGDAGGAWTLVRSTPADQSSYCLAIDRLQPGFIYAPNHFGRGLLRKPGWWAQLAAVTGHRRTYTDTSAASAARSAAQKPRRQARSSFFSLSIT